MANRRSGVKSIYKVQGRKNPWHVTYVDLDGKKHEPSFPRKVDAETAAKRIRAKLDRGLDYDPAAGETPFSEIWESYLKGKSATVKPKTLAGYESLGTSMILSAFGERRVKTILPSEVAGWVADLQVEQGASKSHTRSALVHFKAAMESAVRDKLIDGNPAQYVAGPGKGPRREGKSLTAEQLFLVADQMPTPTDRAFTLTLGLAGLRFGEASGLQVRAVDLDRRLLKIQRTYSEVRGKLVDGPPKNHQSRTVPIPATLVRELRPLLGDKPSTSDVFTRGRGGVPRASNWLPRVYRPALLQVSCEDEDGNPRRVFPDANDRVVHDLRHTYASMAVRAGANIKALSRVMGHADADETLNTYADLYPEDYDGLGDSIEASVYTVSTDSSSADTEKPRSATQSAL